MQLKTRRLALAVLVAVSLISGCGSNPNPQTDPTRNLSPAGRAAYQTTRIVKALDVLRDVAAAGERQNPRIISAASALKVIAYHRQVVTTMDAVPDGWKAVALAGLTSLQQNLTADEWKQIEPFVTLLQTLYNTFVPPGQPPSSSALWWTAHTHYQGGH